MSRYPAHIIASTVIFLMIAGSYLVMAVYFPFTYIIGTYEDFFGEWSQFFFAFSVFILSLRLSFMKTHYRLFFIFVAVASFYVSMEEISWGQRIFGITPPEFFSRHNLQGEMNLHNFITGPYDTEIKRITEYLLFVFLSGYGLIYPYAFKRGSRAAVRLEGKGLAPPPLYLWPFFVISGILELNLFSFNEAEVAEILIPLGLALSLLYHVHFSGSEYTGDGAEAEYLSKSKRLCIETIVLFMIVALASSGATYASYSTPRIKRVMTRKVDRGIEKFAGRYMRAGFWENAIKLYTRTDNKEPGRPSIQRRLADCYLKKGNRDKWQQYIDRALDIDSKRLAELPISISAHLSISKTYLQMNEKEQARVHLELAEEIARDRVKKKPGSARAAYWMGKVYEQKGEQDEALRFFKKAFDLRPDKSKYRRAYFFVISRRER